MAVGVVNAPLSDTASFLPDRVAESKMAAPVMLYVILAPILIRSYIFLMPAAEAIDYNRSQACPLTWDL